MYKKLALQNFLSWENLQFDFPEGVTLIEGFNYDDNSPEGCGKSAILNGLTWTLYGQIPKDVKVNQVIREGAKEATGYVELLSGHTIIRTRRVRTGGLQLFMPDGKEYIGKDILATQKYIDELMGMTYDTFLQSVYFAQNYGVKFITSDEKLRVKVLSDIADLSVFDKAIKETTGMMKLEKDSKKDLERDLEETSNKTISKKTLLEQLNKYQKEAEEELKEKTEKLTKKFDQKAEEVEELTTFLDENSTEGVDSAVEVLQESADECDKLIEGLTIKLGSTDAIKAEMKGLDNEIQSKMLNYKNLERELKLKELNKERTENRFSELEPKVDVAIDTLRVSFSKLEAKITKLQNPEAENCPTCGTALAKLEAGHFDKEIGELLKEQEDNQAQEQELIKQFEADVVKVDSEIADINSQIEEVKNSMEEVEEQAKDIQAELDCITLPDLSAVSLEIEETKAKRRSIRVDILDLTATKKGIDRAILDLDKLEVELKELDVELKEAEATTITKFYNDISEAKKEIKASELEETELTRILKEKTVALEELTKLREGFRETKAYTFKALLRDLTNKANFYLEQLFDLPIGIEFTNETEEGGIAKIVDVVTIGETQRPFALYSGGQARRIQLAVDLALSDIVAARGDKPIGLLVMDEVCKDLSENSMEKVIELFEGLDKSVLMIEHNSIIKNVVSNTFEIGLKNGISYVV